jgi:hypothetical protein
VRSFEKLRSSRNRYFSKPLWHRIVVSRVIADGDENMCGKTADMRNIPAGVGISMSNAKQLCAVMDHIIKLAKATLALAR